MLWLTIGFVLGVLLMGAVARQLSLRANKQTREVMKQVRRSERLAEMGRMTSGLAHEIKNPLSTIGLNLQLLHEDLDDLVGELPSGMETDDKIARVQRVFGALGRETQRLKDILEDFLRFAGRMKLEAAETDVHALIEELVDFFGPQAEECGVHLRTQLLAKPSEISVDGKLLKQALLNLMINAVQAMTEAKEKGGDHGGASELMIRTENEEVSGKKGLAIHVTDTGPGIGDEVMKRVFEPYFSTKRGGSGLGLPTSRRIAEEHGGELLVHAEAGRGTDFAIRLPREDINS
ncbi:Sensor protein ZraS [Poriferisphaera corsica]|uniref:histidine kinase n=1 Tax=Poriferisphaera corsica TaxID=2528020 RepID=A0A517YQM5_9BACT|nr:ATP-binding protein [Poriferisphaera corsica]QDU32514.1 Sensor protein ZraS [Poriferisphaera corsica]